MFSIKSKLEKLRGHNVVPHSSCYIGEIVYVEIFRFHHLNLINSIFLYKILFKFKLIQLDLIRQTFKD